MGHLMILVYSAFALTYLLRAINAGETVLSTVLTPQEDGIPSRQSRSYYDDRYGVGSYDRLQYDRPTRCGRCDDRYDDRDDYDRPRDRFDDDRRGHRPSNRFDKNKNYDDDDDRKVGSDRRSKSNGTDDADDGDKKRPYDDEKRPSGGRRDRDRDRDRNRYDDRERYRPDYYDRFLRDPYRERDHQRPYDDPYRRAPYDRYPDRYDDPYGGYSGGGYNGGGYGGGLSGAYAGYRRPVAGYDERYDRGNGYDDAYAGYGPSAGRGPHDSFRPWDETFRGQAGWDAGGRGYYFASGRPEAGAAAAWGRPDYNRPEVSSGWQSAYRDPYAGAGYAPDTGYRQDPAGYGRPSGWHSVGERRPYRDQSGVNALDTKGTYNQPSRQYSTYGQANRGQTYGQSYGQATDAQSNRGQSYGQGGYGQGGRYGQVGSYGQANDALSNRGQSYGQGGYGQGGSYGQANDAQSNRGQSYGQGGSYGQATAGTSGYTQTSTTPGTSYLYQREDEQVTTKATDETTKQPS